MELKKFDVAVLGGGPGGYPAAIRAAQKGLSVALIEVKELGGTCLNRGCIPSKTLIASAEVLHKIQEAEKLGISTGSVEFDYKKMAERKDQVVKKMRSGLESLIASNQITLFRGYGRLSSANTIKIFGENSEEIEASRIIIATGSESRNLQAFPFDYKKIHNSTSLLEMQELPKKIGIIGGGVIGCEFASLFATLGSEVTLIEMMARIIPMEEVSVSEALTKAFRKKGIAIEANVSVEKADTSGNGVHLKLTNGKEIDVDILLVAVGRKLNTDDIGLDKVGISVHDNGIIPVDERMETCVKGIYAVGDIASKWWLAHVATHQGIVAADNAAGGHAEMNYDAVPSVIFTHPEVATVGLSLEQALKKGYKAIQSAFPFQVLGKSQAMLETEGFSQIVIDKDTGQILGAQVVGYEASTLIAEMAVAIRNELTIECVTETIHAHPTISEAWMEAAFLNEGLPLHLPPKFNSLKKKQ